jgi:hypothetical protein
MPALQLLSMLDNQPYVYRQKEMGPDNEDPALMRGLQFADRGRRQAGTTMCLTSAM